MFSSSHAFDGLFGMDLRRGGQNHRLQAGTSECFIEIGCPMRDAVLLGGGFRCFSSPAINTDDFRVFDALESFQMLLGKRTLPNHTNLHCLPPYKNPFVEKPNILTRNSLKRARDLL